MELMEAATMPRDTTGFKRTEAGVIPEDWQALRLSDCITVHRGGSPRPIESFITNDLNGVNWIKIGDAEKYGKYIRSTSEKIIPAGVKFSREVRAGDFLLSNSMSFGRPYILAVDGCIHDGWLVLQNYQATFDKDFLYYTLSDRYLLDQYQAKAAGSGVLNLNKELIGTVHLRVPPLPEQRAIATALSDVDGLLAGLDALIAKKKALKQGAMQQLLTGKQRLPGFKGEWVVRRLGDVAEVISGATPRTNVPAYWNGNIPWCTPTDITGTDGKYISVTERSITKEGLDGCNTKLLPKGALLLCTRATIGEIKIATAPICTNQGFKSLACGPLANNEFLYYKLLTMKDAMVEKAIGSTFLELSRKDTVSLELTMPTIEEQAAIAEVLSDMDAELGALEARRAKTALLKQGMMQELLTGRTRLIK